MQSFLKEHGYVWESGISGHWTFGPQGTALKRSIENYLRNAFNEQEFSEIETPLLLHKDVLVRSGHWDKFRDPIVHTKSGKVLRLDHLIEEMHPTADYSALAFENVLIALNHYNLTAADQVVIPTKLEYRDLMMRTNSGSAQVGLRPETATATFNNFLDLLQHNNKQYPIRVYQIGKSFRNEINPRNGIIRGREFTQAEFQIILPAEMKNESKVNVTDLQELPTTEPLLESEWNALPRVYAECLLFVYQKFVELGVPTTNIRLRRHAPDERAFYALDAWDIEVNLRGLGWTEIAGIHDRGGYDLRHHKMKKGVPHIIEVAIGIDRLVYSVLDTLYEDRTEREGKTVLKIPYTIAPILVAVFPVVRSNLELVKVSRNIYTKLKSVYSTEYAEKASIGRRYLKAAVKGIPYCVTVDKQTLEDQTVTLRDRDTEHQDRVLISDLISEIQTRKMSWLVAP